SGFPNSIFGSCVQMLLDSELGNKGTWTNVECSTPQAYLCFRNGGVYGPTAFPPGCNHTCSKLVRNTRAAQIYSPNYPLSIPSLQSCEYIIGTKEGTSASITFRTINCQSGTSFSFYDGLNNDTPFL
ncbi:hypothetical protein PMAYCL1PPCAC_03364, partial [Pristionchus mayeri]